LYNFISFVKDEYKVKQRSSIFLINFLMFLLFFCNFSTNDIYWSWRKIVKKCTKQLQKIMQRY